MLIDRDGYEIYDLKGKKTERVPRPREGATSTADLVGADSMTDAHFANFIAGIKTGEKLHAPVAVGNVAVTMLQLSNIAWEVNRELSLDPKDGKIKNDTEAMKLWGRDYEKGWEPKNMNTAISRRNFVRSGALLTAAGLLPTARPAFAEPHPGRHRRHAHPPRHRQLHLPQLHRAPR